MKNQQILRQLGQTDRDKEKRLREAREEVKEIKRAIFEEKELTEVERELPEHDALITKHHLRHARRVQDTGRRMGATVDRLPIHKGEKAYHQKDHRVPKKLEFEGPLDKLIEKYGPAEADEYFSLGQHQKYQKKVNRETGGIEYWNINDGEREYPPQTVAEQLKHKIRQALREPK